MIKVCVIGLGNHAKNKIIPAIKSIRNSQLALVTSQKDLYEINARVFKNLDEAISNLEKDYIFYICTPPSSHFKIASVILNNKFNCLIEKPVVLNSSELNNIISISSNHSNYFYECFMYKFGKIYLEFRNIFLEKLNEIKSLQINFCIPKIPDNTFRTQKNTESSLIYDMGCYPISLINEISNEKNLKLIYVENYGNIEKEKFYVKGNIGNIDLNIVFGVNQSYENYITLNLNNEEKITLEYFFYGREYEKKIRIIIGSSEQIRVISDGNLFMEMLKNTGNNMHKSQSVRNKVMKRNLIDLENLINDYRNLSL